MPFLVTPPLPNCRVEIAFDSGFATPEGDRTWTDVTDLVEGALGATITYGRADELSTPDPNTLSIAFDNRLGHFTPGKSTLADGSPHPFFPNVKKGKPIRFTSIYGGVDYIRFTGYINEYPLVWPDGSSAASTVTVTATSRRARLGQTAPLTSAIRAAYLATGPQAYWPMDEEYGTIAQFPDLLFFRDVSNKVDNPDPRRREYLTTWWTAAALQPVIQDGTPGPTDEASLVRLPSFSDIGLLGQYPHYIGAGGVVDLAPSAGVTMECVARVRMSSNDNLLHFTTLMNLLSSDLTQAIFLSLTTINSGSPDITCEMMSRDPATNAVVEDQYDFVNTSAPTDGEIHHFCFTLNTAGTQGKFYFDGTLVKTLTFATAVFTSRFTAVAFASDTLNSTAWVGHGAVHNRALTAAEVLAHADAATAATETPDERVVRIAGRVGVPAAEVDTEVTIAADLGSQPEAGRSASEILDETASSTGGVLYDSREGHLALQARNHRYNLASAFILDATAQEIEGDLTVTDDHRYTVNTVVYSRTGSEDVAATITDQDSIDDYGVFSQTYTVVSEEDTEVESFAQNILARYADPAPRVSTVSVDITNTESTQRDLVLTADIGTRFGIQSLPGQAPTDPMYLFLEGYTETITATSHTLSMNTTPADIGQNVFILDDPTYGVLDQNVLAY